MSCSFWTQGNGWLRCQRSASHPATSLVVVWSSAIAGAWQRQGRKVTIHAFRRFDAATREAIEHEAATLPIAGRGDPVVRWAPAGPATPSERFSRCMC
jgi:hypothetical protein